jgi:hypothetical protein
VNGLDIPPIPWPVVIFLVSSAIAALGLWWRVSAKMTSFDGRLGHVEDTLEAHAKRHEETVELKQDVAVLKDRLGLIQGDVAYIRNRLDQALKPK